MKTVWINFLFVAVVLAYSLHTAVHINSYVDRPNPAMVDDFAPPPQRIMQNRYQAESSNTQSNRIRRDSTKPYLIIHAGPTKTGTTSLQTDLTRINDTFAEDNWYYAGRYYQPIYKPGTKSILKIQRSQSPLVDSLVTVFLRFLTLWPEKCERPDCMNALSQELYKHKGKNILISDESISKRGKRDPEAFRQIAEMFGKDWEIMIIGSYRRFFEWLPSDLFQGQRLDSDGEKKRRKNQWPGLKGSVGRKMKTLFPNHYKTWENPDHPHAFTTHLRDSVNNTVTFKILDMHREDSYKSVQTRFVCDLLPGAPAACNKMRELERDQALTVANKGGLPDVLHLNYDILVVDASGMGLIDMERFDRKALREEVREYNEGQLKKTPFDFPLICPTPTQQEEYLEMSLRYERQVLGEDIAAQVEEKHRSAFREFIEKKDVCRVDSKAALESEPWKSFFAKYSPPASDATG